jgi:transcriptional regulator with XRE-family HTH domain
MLKSMSMIILSQLRRQRGWSQAELARRARMHPSSVSLLESGRLKPSSVQLRKLARVLCVPASLLLDAAGILEGHAIPTRQRRPTSRT